VHLDIPQKVARIGADREIALFRVFQECLSNVRKHAQTDEAFVRLAQEEKGLLLEVEDRGVGMGARGPAELPREQHGIGLLKMRERLLELGGSLELISQGNGTLVRARMPEGNAAHTMEVADQQPQPTEQVPEPEPIPRKKSARR
jgi:signal transduction histidine kinase